MSRSWSEAASLPCVLRALCVRFQTRPDPFGKESGAEEFERLVLKIGKVEEGRVVAGGQEDGFRPPDLLAEFAALSNRHDAVAASEHKQDFIPGNVRRHRVRVAHKTGPEPFFQLGWREMVFFHDSFTSARDARFGRMPQNVRK